MRRLLLSTLMLTAWLGAQAQCPPSSAYTTPYLEDFDTLSTGQTGSNFGNCYLSTTTSAPNWETNSGGTTSSATGPTSDKSGSGIYVYTETSGASAGDTTSLITPDIDISGVTTPELTFWYHMYGEAIGSLEVDVWDGSTWSNELTINGEQQTANSDPYRKAIVDLSNYSGNIKLRFFVTVGSTGFSYNCDVAIDEVDIHQASACPQPTNFQLSTIGPFSATLAWNAVSTASGGYEVIYGSQGFNPQSGGTTVNTNNDSIQLSSLAGATTYEAYVIADCGTANGSSDTTGPLTFTTQCVAFTAPYSNNFDSESPDAPATCWAEYNNYNTSAHANVQIPSSFNATQPYSGSRLLELYSYFGFGTSDTLMAISPEFSDMNAGDKQIKFYAATQDLASELYIATTTSQTPGSSYDIIDTVTFSTINTWQLQIIALDSANGYNGTDDHVVFLHNLGGTFDDIYIDDFTYETQPACPQLLGLSPNNLTNTSVDLSTLNNVSDFEMEWGPCGFNQGTGTLDSTSSGTVSLSGLAGNTCYDVYIRRDCGAAGTSIWTGPFSVTTRCNPFTAPYSNNFDSDSAGQVPTCWDTYFAGTNSSSAAAEVQQASSFTPANSSPNHVRFYNYDIDTTWLISPAFSDLTAADKRVQFYARSSSSFTAGDIIVGTVSSPSNPSSFSAVDTVAVTDTYQNFIVPLDAANGYNGTHTYVVLVHDGGTFDTYYLDDFAYEDIPSCNGPISNQTGVSALTASAASIFWGGGQGDTTKIVWGAPGFTPATGAIGTGFASGTDTTFTITGLAPQTSYEFYLQDSCAISGAGVYVGPFSFTTECLPVVAPLTENFDNTSTWSGTTLDPCWGSNAPGGFAHQWEANSGGTTSGSTGPSGDNTTGSDQYLYTETSPSSPSTAVLTTPLVDVSSLNVPYFEFYYHRYGSNMGDLTVDLNDGTGWTTIITLNGDDQQSSGDPWKARGLDISSYGDTVQIRFSSTYGGGFNGDGAIDDVSFIEAPACPDPVNLQASALSDTGTTLQWSDISSANDYEVWFGSAGFFQGTQTATGVRVFTGGPDSLRLDTLTPNTCYDFLVRAACGAGDTSAWIGPVTFCTPCTPFSAPYFQDWDALTVPSIDRCWTPYLVGSSNAIETDDFNPYSSPNSLFIDNGSTFSNDTTAVVSPTFSDMTVGDKRVTFYVRAEFSSNETDLWVGTAGSTNDGSSFNILDTIVVQGNDNWRQVIVNLNSQNNYNGTDEHVLLMHDNSNGFDGILVDDFQYETIPSCPRPFPARVTSVDSTSVDVSWSGSSASTFQVEYGAGSLGSANNQDTTVSINNPTLTNLMSGTNQSYWVRAICGPGDTSQWSGPIDFLTNCRSKTVRYIEDFDAQNTDETPLCWSEYFRGGTANFWAFEVYSFGTPYSTPNHVRFYNYNTDTAMGISPRFRDMDAGDKRFRFRAKTSFGTGTIYVGTVSDPADGSTFDPVDTININSTGYPEYTVELTTANGYNGTDEYLALYHGGSTFDTYYLDDFFYETIPSCIAPSGFTSSNLGQNSVDLNWQADTATASGDYVVQYGTSGVLNDPANTTTAVTGDSASITGLSSASNYCFWVASVCTPGDTSFYTGPICVTTKCFPATAPYLETFDGSTWVADDQDFSATNSQIGACWTRTPDNGTDYSWRVRSTSTGSSNTGPDQDATGGNFVYTESSNGISGDNASLFSQEVDLSNSTNPTLIYGYHFYGSDINQMEVAVNNGSGWSTINTRVGPSQASSAAAWEYDTLALSSYLGDTIQVRFQSTRSGGFAGDLALDEIFIGDLPSCSGPKGVSTQGASTTSTTISWSQDTGSQSTILEYGPAGFTPGNGTTVTSSSTSYTLSGMSQNVCMDVYLRGVCSSGDTTFQTGPIKACPDQVTCDSLDQYSTGVALSEQSALFKGWAGNAGDGDLSTNQASSGTQSLRIYDSGPAGASDVVAVFDTISSGAWNVELDLYVESGKGAYFNIQQNYIGGAAGNLWGGEIYFKDNGVAEVRTGTGLNLVGTFNYSQGQWITVSSIIDLDNDTAWFELNGNSTGVGYIYSSVNGAPIQFNGVNFYSGVVSSGNYDIDYYVDNFCITPYSGNCPAPTNLSTANAGCDSVEVSWTSNSGSSVLQYGPAGFTPGTGTFTGVVTSPHSITGLNPNTAYDVWVADTCGGDTSMFTGPVSFTTANAPQPVASFTIDSAVVGNIEFYYLDASGSTNADSYQWSFGNGTTGSSM
ncbi:MAG: hypothetical protein RI842_07950, partial [Schleiferiaceae bacterium]|nr:hypothetical protein [Schleiferiaceae bacterium]